MEKEVWKDIPGYEGLYQASQLGRVKSLERTILRRGYAHKLNGRIMSLSNRRKDGTSYLTVGLCKDANPKNFLVHVLIAITFLNYKPDAHNYVVDHKNDIKTDNRAENLQVLTHRRNVTKKKYRGNTDSVGVHWCAYRRKFLSTIQENGKITFIGGFDKEKEASDNYKRARLQIENGEKVGLIRKPLSSKYPGVTWHKREKKWRVQIKVDGKQKQIGSYKTELEAKEAYINYEKTLKK